MSSSPIRRLFTTEAQVYLRARGFPISRESLLGWAQKYGVGQRFGKRWWFTPQALDLIAAGYPLEEIALLEEIASRRTAHDVEAA